MIPAEQWQKEAGTHAIHCQGADEVYPNVSLDLIKRIQRDAWRQGIEDSVEVAMDTQVIQFRGNAAKSDAAQIVEWAIRDLRKKGPQ